MSNKNDTNEYKWQSLFTSMIEFSNNVCLQKAVCDSLRSEIECNPSLCDIIGEESDSQFPIHNCVTSALKFHMKDEYLFQSACGVIYQLSINSKRIQESYFKQRVYILIIEEISINCNHCIQGWGLHALRGLCHDHLIQKKRIFECQIFKHIVRVLLEIKDICVLKECIGLLACLAQDLEAFRKECVDFGIPVIILDIMVENIRNEELVEIVLEALAYFFQFQEDMLLKLANIQSIHNVIKFYQSNEGVNLKVCVIFQLIAVHKCFIEQQDVFCEVVEIIKDAVNGFKANYSIKLEGLVAFALLLADCSYDKYKAIINSNVLENFLTIFESSDPMLSLLAKLCLRRLTFEQSITNLVFQSACFYGFKKCLRLLVEWGADFNSSSNEGNSLCIAVMNNHIEIVEYLLALKPPNISEALHCALEKNLHDIVGILLCYIGYEEDNRAIKWSELNISYLREEYFLPSILQSRKNVRSDSVLFNIDLKEESEFLLLCKNKIMLKDRNITRSVKFLAVSRLPFNDLDPRNLNYLSENLEFDFVNYCEDHFNLKRPCNISSPIQIQKITSIQTQSDMDKCILNLDISKNQINDLENLAISINLTLNDFFSNLVELDVSNNKLNELSIGFCSLLNSLKSLRASNNNLKQLPYSLLKLQKIVELDVSANHISTIEPEMIPNTISIKKLDISNNQLTKFPVCFLHKFPFLQHLFLSNNNITALLVSGEFVSLKTLTLSFNQLTKLLSRSIECFVSLEKLDLSHNLLTDLPYYNPQTLLQLSNLNLSHNRLTAKGPFYLPKFILDLPSLIHLDISNNLLTCLPDLHYWSSKKIRELNFSNNDITELPLNKYSKLFWPKISSLIISNNKIKVLPTYIGELSSLCILDVSNNKQLKTLPDDIGKLVNLYQFPLTGLNLCHGAVLNGTPRDLVLYFRSKLEKSVPYRCIKLMLVGLAGRGKTSLISQLSKKVHSPNKLATVGIEVRRFVLQPPGLALNRTNSKCPSFSVNAWDFAGQEDFYSTHRYFLSSKAIYLAVYNASKGEEELKKLTPWLLNIQTVAPSSKVILVGTHADLCTQESLQSLNAFTKYFLHSSGFPTFYTTSVVDCTKENNKIVLLRTEIYKCISKFMFEEKSILEKMVPQSYVTLEKFIFDKAKTMHNSGELPILSKNHLHQHLIDHGLRLETDEFNKALTFLTKTGSILNFNDPVYDMENLIFIDPQWFFQMMARVVTIKEINPYISKKGILSKSDAFKYLFPDPCFTQNFVKMFFRLLQRFEVLLLISDDEYLVTSKLPSSSPKNLIADNLIYFNDVKIVTRRYDFPYIPIGFWPRLIARILSFPELTSSVRPKNLSFKTDYWQNGVYLEYSDAFCLVSGDDKNLNILDVKSQRSLAGYQLFVGVIDLIDGLVDEWYSDIFQEKIVKQLVPCHYCKINDKRFTFDLNVCIASSYTSDKIQCSECNQFSDIGFIAPDAVLADLGDLVISDWDNKFLDKKYKLGTGAFASVYKVNINGAYFAAKVYNKSPGNCLNRMLRQEVDILKRLHHPCLISFTGVSIRPRALLIEYSPLGNLANYIASKNISKNKSLTHKIALQVAEGLAFIHKHNIVHRDLNPKNIIVFSCSLKVPVNVKLSDYGISQHKTYQGLIANMGTPKYKAPEVVYKESEYSIEVDIFSYGVTIYELISNGQKPFRDINNQNEFEDAVLSNRPIDSLISHGFAPWPDMEDLIKYCLRKNPEERPKAKTIVKALTSIDLLCLKKNVAVCKGQFIDCLTTCVYFESKVEHIEVWAASSGCGLNSQLTWFSVTQTKKQEVQGTMTKIERILCMISYKHFIIVGTKERRVALYDAKAKCFKHELSQFSDSILCILHRHGLFIFGLADGNIAVLTSDSILNPGKKPRYICLNDKISQNPIFCMTQSQDQIICGYGEDIKLLNLSTFDLLQTVSATHQNVKKNAVTSLIVFQNRLIISFEKSYKLMVYTYTGNRVDESDMNVYDCSEILKKDYPNIIESDCCVTTLELVDNSSLWIGCGGGHVIIVNVLKSFFQDVTIISRHLGAVRSITSTPKLSGEPVSVITSGQGFRQFRQKLVCSDDKSLIKNDVEECEFILLWNAKVLKLKNNLIAERKNRDDLLNKLSVKMEMLAIL